MVIVTFFLVREAAAVVAAAAAAIRAEGEVHCPQRMYLQIYQHKP